MAYFCRDQSRMDSRDIANTDDVKQLVDTFYTRVLKDAVIGHIFTEVAPISWEKHMPIMYAFWNSVILSVQGYEGNPMTKHIQLHKIFPLQNAHFERWLQLWEDTVSSLFKGSNATMAIARAKSIAGIMEHKLNGGGMV